MSSNHDITIKLGGFEVVCNVDITPYDPGNTSGPVEACYPPEGGDIDINDIRLRLKPGTSPDCFLEISDLIAALNGGDIVCALVDEEVGRMLAEPPEPPEPDRDYDTYY
jgi:hypothetical protein